MVEIRQTIKRVGGSLMIRIPKDLVDELGVQEGDIIYFEPKKKPKNNFGKYPELKGWTKTSPKEFSKYA